jgi:hypothetical protein
MTKKYKRDSVRGRCPIIDPVNYKPDTLLQVWIDSRKLVMLDKWLGKNGISTRFMADIGREVLDIVVDQLLATGEVEKVELSRDAMDYLKIKFRKLELNPGGRGKRNIQHNLVLDSRRERGLMEESDHSMILGVTQTTNRNSEEEIERRRLNEEASARAFKQLEEEQKREAKEAITSRLTFDENGVAIIPKTEGMYTAEERKKEIAQTHERLGLKQPGATEGSVGSSQNSHPDECIEDGDKKEQTPASAEEALSLFNKVRDKQSISAKQDLTPRKLTSSEVMSKEEKLKLKDRELKSQLDSITPNDLSPIDD